MLEKSGIDFAKHQQMGIEMGHFGELLMSSGFVLSHKIKWVSYHRYVRNAPYRTTSFPDPGIRSVYDFAYLLKILTCKPLPETQQGFYQLLNLYFPCLYDIKLMMSMVNPHSFTGSLKQLAIDLGVCCLPFSLPNVR